MNILPKKSWHVLSRTNVQKVRKDEAEAKAIEEELARRAALAEQEARIEFMRKRSRGNSDGDIKRGERKRKAEKQEPVEKDSSQHINFFSDLKTGIGLEGAVNSEHEAEKKAEQEKWEKKVGILTYLVDKESSSSQPWYLKKKSKTDESGEKRSLTDPLDDMKTYLKMKKKRTPLDLPPPPPPSVSHPSLQRDCEHIPEKSHKHKKRNKRDKKEKQKQLQELREERNRREERERAKSEALLRRHYGEEDKITSKPIEEIPGRYNSQYNPHLARTKSN